MRLRTTLLASLSVTLLFGALTSGATARRFLSSSRFPRATFARLDFTGGFGTTECAVTLESSLHSATIEKIAELLIGYIYEAEVPAATGCISGGLTVLKETLPWHMRYESFRGTLPDITFVRTRIIGAAIRIRERGGIICLVRTSVAEPAFATYRRNVGTQVLTDVTASGEIRTGPECFGVRGTLVGISTSLVSALGSPITLQLI